MFKKKLHFSVAFQIFLDIFYYLGF